MSIDRRCSRVVSLTVPVYWVKVEKFGNASPWGLLTLGRIKSFSVDVLEGTPAYPCMSWAPNVLLSRTVNPQVLSTFALPQG